MSEMETIINLQPIREQGEELMRALEDFLLNPDAKHGETVDFLAGLSRFASDQYRAYLHYHTFKHAGLVAFIEVEIRDVITDGTTVTVSPYISNIKFDNHGQHRITSFNAIADITMIARDAIDLD